MQRARDQVVQVRFAVAELTLANIVSEAQRLVEYARTKGAPDDAAIRIEGDPMYRDNVLHESPPALPHDAHILWRENEYRRAAPPVGEGARE